MTENSILEIQSPASLGKDNQASGRTFNRMYIQLPLVLAQGSYKIIPLNPHLYSLLLVYTWEVFLLLRELLFAASPRVLRVLGSRWW